jgi:hypothetical protein
MSSPALDPRLLRAIRRLNNQSCVHSSLHAVIARNKPRVCIGTGLNIRDHGQNRRNAVRVHVSYSAFLRARAFRPYKALIGPRLRARGFAAQQTEAAIGVAVLNQMLAAGRPESVRRQRMIA